MRPQGAALQASLARCLAAGSRCCGWVHLASWATKGSSPGAVAEISPVPASAVHWPWLSRIRAPMLSGHRLGWRTDLVFQMPRERAQPLGAEIPLALRQLRDIAPPGVSPLAEDADVVLSLRFYFLTARIPLATAQVQHLISPERLVFGSAPLPRVAKRPRHAAPFSLVDLIARLRQPGRAPPA